MPPLPMLLLVGGVSMLLMGVVGGFLLIPKIVAQKIAEEKVLTPGSMSRGLFEKFPEPLYLKIYMWNVTNPKAVMKGAKPVLQEIGPFVFDEYKWKVKVKDRNMDDSVAFKPLSWFYWNQNASGTLTGNEMVTIPNILLLSIVLKVEMEMSVMLSMINGAVMELFRKPDSVYMTVKVRDLLFDGISINCTVKEFTTKTMCLQLRAENRKEIKEVSPNIFQFSFFGARNGTEGDWMRSNRGSKDPSQVGNVMTVRDNAYLSTWRGSPCNNISGSDGSSFPAFRKPTDMLHIFIIDLCRSIHLFFVRSDVHREVPVSIYTGTLGDIAANKSLHCFCRTKSVNSCPKKGSMDLTKCMGSPIILTLPHFYLAAPEFLKQSVGLKPEPELHQINVELEPNTGTPLNVAVRLQFNIEIHNISRITVMKNLRKCMHPILWMEQGITVPDQYVNLIKDQLLVALKLINYGKWGMILAGLGMTAVGGALHSRQQRNVVTPLGQMEFESTTPEEKKVQAFVKDSQANRWKGGKEGNADVWVNDMEGQRDSRVRLDPGRVARWRDRDMGMESWIQTERHGDRWQPHEEKVDRDPEMEEWMKREQQGDRRQPTDRWGREADVQSWMRRELQGDVRQPRLTLTDRETEIQPWMRREGQGGREVEGQPPARDAQVGFRDVQSWMDGDMPPRDWRADREADVETWLRREVEGDSAQPRVTLGDRQVNVQPWMQRGRPVVNRRPRVEGHVDPWQGRTWPVRRY